MIRITSYTFMVIFCFLSGCSIAPSKKENMPLIENDPFIESFKGKGVKMAIAEESGSPSVKDTLYFDQDGRMVEKTELYSNVRYGYDSIGNLKRQLTMNDIPSNYLIDYEEKEGVILQNWYPLSHLRWDLENERLDTAERVVAFKFDEQGRLQEEENLSIGEITKYEYRGSRISAKQVYPEASNEPTLQWSYQYSEQGLLENAKCLSQGELIIGHYFGNDGLLDSTRMKNYTLVYSYEYY